MVTLPNLSDVKPGDPISSWSWNDVLKAIRTLADEANKRRGTVTVKVVDTQKNPVRGATVTAQPQGDPPRMPRAATFVGTPTNAYLFDQMLPGKYTLSVEAEGFTAQPTSVTITVSDAPDPAPVGFTLTSMRVAVPNLLGLTLDAARNQINVRLLHVGSVFESHGDAVTDFEDAKALRVLGQSPMPETLAAAGTSIFLVVGAKPEVVKRIRMPELRGMTLTEARAAIEAAGLTLGDMTPQGGSRPSDL